MWCMLCLSVNSLLGIDKDSLKKEAVDSCELCSMKIEHSAQVYKREPSCSAKDYLAKHMNMYM